MNLGLVLTFGLLRDLQIHDEILHSLDLPLIVPVCLQKLSAEARGGRGQHFSILPEDRKLAKQCFFYLLNIVETFVKN